tara:strand:- start:1149 stop:1580 length:432 start_codon:yes stop_codon:yes gene_type:complete
MHIKIVLVGKIKERAYNEKIQKYLEWLSRDVKFEVVVIKDSKLNKTIHQIDKYKKNNFFCICLSEHGKNLDSISFSKFIFSSGEKVVFFIGGPNGYSKSIIKRMDFILSLSKMTMPHEMSALILTEQLFRAFSIKKGSKYHRD